MYGRDLVCENKMDDTSSLRIMNSIPLSKEDYVCPITYDIFLFPTMTIPCGHLFEENAISEWNKQGHTSCPCCREEIVGFSPVPPFFYSHFKQVLKENTFLYQEQYFNIELLNNFLLGTDVTRYSSFFMLLKHAKKKLNAIEVEGFYEGACPVTLLSMVEIGRSFFEDEQLRANISVQGLNTTMKNGKRRGGSALTCFAAEENCLKYFTDPLILSKITSEGFNAIFKEGLDTGASAIYFLAQNRAACQMLCDNKFLRNLPTKENLLQKVYQIDGSKKSAVDFLHESKEGRALLYYHEDFRKKCMTAEESVIFMQRMAATKEDQALNKVKKACSFFKRIGFYCRKEEDERMLASAGKKIKL